MREIKFRAWDKEQNKMFRVDKARWILFGSPEELQGISVVDGQNYYHSGRGHELMQYTGLKDKNGVEIYQGDLVRVTADVEGYGATSYGGMVEVTTEMCGYSLKPVSPTLEEIDTHTLYHDSGELMVWDSSSFWHVDEPTNLEVIGNIYEHGHLLEANQ